MTITLSIALALTAAAFLTTYFVTPWFIKKLGQSGHTVRDQNKEDKPKIPEMGGLAIVTGFVVAVIFAVALETGGILEYDLELVLAGLSTILVVALIGVIDDLLLVEQSHKALLPAFASLPLIAVNAGQTQMWLPLVGSIDFGILYLIVIIPAAITGAANACNMLAGFNGLEAGLGLVMSSTLMLVSALTGSVEAFIISTAMAGSLLAFLKYNWSPAKILVGDVGTLSIGAVVASTVIIGNLERAGVILILPFFLELFLKARGRFRKPSFCNVMGDKLVCPKKSEVYGLGRLVMHYSGGIREPRLVLSLILFEVLFAFFAVWSVI